MKAKNKITLIVVFLVVAVALIAWYVAMPSYAEIKKLSNSISEKKLDFDKKKVFLSEMEALKKSYSEIDKSDKEKLGRILPQEENIISLLPELEVVISRMGLNILNMNFESFADNKGTAKKIPKFIKGDAKPVKVSVEVDGGYAAFKNFLNSIEWNERLMDIASIRFKIQQKSGNQIILAGTDQEKFSFVIDLYAYWLQ